MVDLRAASAKLVDRGERIVMAVAGGTREEARQAIDAAGGSVRTAIVMRQKNVARDDAEQLLATHDNRLRPILGDPPPMPGEPA
jgi:N-acetylmuramic acid 6-phosphate etherase